jgi:aryl-alcohol dehydrogenase-like predicted oxidoreductase
MEFTTFGRTGLKVSRMAFGAGPIGYLGSDQDQAGKVLNLLLDQGVNVIDTAAAYLGSEELIGKAVSERRHDFVLVSKCGRKVDGVEGEDWSARLITATVDRSLRRLRTDHLDVMLLHSCPEEVLENGEALGALIRAKEAGKIRFAGYSGDNLAATTAVSLAGVDVLMCSANLCDQANLEGALPAAALAGTGVIAKRSVANAAWKPLDAQQGLYRDYVKPYMERFAAMGLRPEELGFSGPQDWMEIALRFTLDLKEVQVVSIGTTNPVNAEANLRILKKGPLPKEAVAVIRQAFHAAQERLGTAWPGLT